jgi:ABC-type multidrug transport system fused ATPase/permease subunit
MSIVPSDPPQHTHGGTQYGGNIYHKNNVISCLPSLDEVFELASSLKSLAFISFMYGNELRVRHIHKLHAKNVIEHRRWEKTFTKKQLDVYCLFQKYIVHPDGIANKPPEIMWIVGPAGCGKSQLVCQIVSLCEHENAKCV